MFDYAIQTVVLSSLCRVFPEVDPCREEKTDFSCMKNEPLSFQVAYRLLSGTSGFSSSAVFAKPAYISVHS